MESHRTVLELPPGLVGHLHCKQPCRSRFAPLPWTLDTRIQTCLVDGRWEPPAVKSWTHCPYHWGIGICECAVDPEMCASLTNTDPQHTLKPGEPVLGTKANLHECTSKTATIYRSFQLARNCKWESLHSRPYAGR